MADTNLPATPADGNIKTVLVPAIENVKYPTTAEVTAETSIDISCYLTAGGFAFTIDQATIADERECDTITRGLPGRKTPSLSITGIDNTNGPYAEESNDLAEALVEGSRWFAVRRRGLPHTVELGTGDIVTVTDFVVGGRAEVASEANSVIRSTWSTFVQQLETDAVIDGEPESSSA